MKKRKVTVYTPESSLRDPTRMLRNMFHDLIAGRELAWQLAVRDIRAQYRQTALGLLWAFILPLAHTLTWIFLSRSGIVTVRDTTLPYPVYVFTGTMMWAIFMDAVNAPLQQTIASKQMLAKLNFPQGSTGGLRYLPDPVQRGDQDCSAACRFNALRHLSGMDTDLVPAGHTVSDSGRHSHRAAADPSGNAIC